MLASLLPGLRDIRTPLTVGYLYLLLGWIWFADDIPRARPNGDGLIARLFDLGDALGRPAALAALSFVAYVLGALLTISSERGFGRLVLDTRTPAIGIDARQTRFEMFERLRETHGRILEHASGWSPEQMSRLDDEIGRAQNANAADLRTRLLVANQELYSEYDRLAAEAEFRLNLVLPLLMTGITASAELSLWYLPASAAVVLLLAFQGLARRAEAQSVISRAVLSGTIRHPMETLLARFDDAS